MSQQIQTAANVSTATTITTATATTANSLVGWMEQNATLIGIAITLASFIAMITFNYINYRINKGRDEREKRMEVLSKISEMKEKGFSDIEIKETMRLAGVDYAG